jgi:tRNA pseudouridine38-40 synthase
MRNIRLTLAYDGTRYIGWQIQPKGLSVQGTVEAALREFTGFETSLIAAGRTDAGVHALGQIVNFRTESTIPCRGFRAGLHRFFPSDILVRHADEADLSFHATHAAKRKRYRYLIDNSRAAHPFLRNYAYEIPSPLDAPAMHAAAQVLVGKHDFRAFESHHPNTASSVRTIFEASVGRCAGWLPWNADANWESVSPSPGQFVWIDVVADGFLYNMVRAITGTLIRVGQRKWDADDVRRILEGQDRRQAGGTAPACGLYLVSVDYGDSLQQPTDESPQAAKEKDEARP